jgi:hypothetical protein
MKGGKLRVKKRKRAEGQADACQLRAKAGSGPSEEVVDTSIAALHLSIDTIKVAIDQGEYGRAAELPGLQARLEECTRIAANEPGVRPPPNSEYPNISLANYKPDGYVQYFNRDYPGLQCIHWEPKVATTNSSMVFVVNQLLSAEECEAAIKDHDNGENWPLSGTPSQLERGTRSSHSVYPKPGSTIYKLLHERVSRVTNVPVENLEPTKMTRYTEGQWYQGHDDAKGHFQFQDFPHAYRGGRVALSNRIFSCFVYLNDCAEGGTTSFHYLGTVYSYSYS